MSREENSLVVCEQCGLAHRWRSLEPRAVGRCVRCEATLERGHRVHLPTVLALTVTAAVAFAVGISTDVLTLQLRGASHAATLPQAIAETWSEGQELIALVAALTAVAAPALFIALRLYILIPLSSGRVPPGFALCVRALRHASEWNMVEVFTIGILLSLVRLASLADAAPGPGLFALGAVTLLFAAIESAGTKHLWWQVR
jgi:paraquat-inducible protein A